MNWDHGGVKAIDFFRCSLHFVRDMDVLDDEVPVVSVDEQAHEAVRDEEEKVPEEFGEGVRGDNPAPKGH